jgi:hypothetical protein
MSPKTQDNLDFAFSAFMRRNPEFKTHKEIITYYYPNKITSLSELANFIGCSRSGLRLYLDFLQIKKQKKGWSKAKLKLSLCHKVWKAVRYSHSVLTAREIAELIHQEPTETQIKYVRMILSSRKLKFKHDRIETLPLIQKVANSEVTIMEIVKQTKLSESAVRNCIKKYRLPHAEFREMYKPVYGGKTGIKKWARIKPMPSLAVDD